MAGNDLGVMLAHREGREVLPWPQQRLTRLCWERHPADLRTVAALAPRFAAWIESCQVRFAARPTSRGKAGAFRPHLFWPRACREVWGLDAPPAPGDVFHGFMRPIPDGGRQAPDGITPLQWAVWRMYTWGCPLKTLATCTGKVRLRRFAPVRLWNSKGQTAGWCHHEAVDGLDRCPGCGTLAAELRPQGPLTGHHTISVGWGLHDVTAALVAVIEALMGELDTVCWALNPDYASIPEAKLTPGWYNRNRAWILGQKALGGPYVPGPQQRRQWAWKERSWPTAAALENWYQAPRSILKLSPYLFPGSEVARSATDALGRSRSSRTAPS